MDLKKTYIENSFGDLVDVLIGNDLDKSFGFTSSDYNKIGEFMAKDVFDMLIKEKPGLSDYDSIKVIRIIEKFYRTNSGTSGGLVSPEVKYHQVHISCLYDGISVSGSEMIEDLPQKIRQIKLGKILNLQQPNLDSSVNS
jgi:hypothetical protein